MNRSTSGSDCLMHSLLGVVASPHNAAVTSLNTFQVLHAVSLLLPEKKETVSKKDIFEDQEHQQAGELEGTETSSQLRIISITQSVMCS